MCPPEMKVQQGISFRYCLRHPLPQDADACDQQRRSTYASFTIALGILGNALLALGKFLVGLVSQNVALLADAGNNLSDTLAQLIALASFYLARKPADREHPYGHARLEYIASLVLGFLVLAMGGRILYESILGIGQRPEASSSPAYYVFLLLVLLFKLGLYAYYKLMGKRLDSLLLLVSARDYLGDILLSVAILISALIQPRLSWNVNAYVGILVSAIVLKSAWEILGDSFNKVMGTRPSTDLLEEIRGIVEAVPGVMSMDDLILHDYGPLNCFGTLDICVPARLSLMQAHHIANEVEEEVAQRCGVQLTVHVNPVLLVPEVDFRAMKELIQSSLLAIDGRLEAHDIVALADEGAGDQGPDAAAYRVSFDLRLPEDWKMESQDLAAQLRQTWRAEYPGIPLDINLESGYLMDKV